MNEAEKFLMRLAAKGGYIVSSADCSTVELAFARTEGRWFTIDSFGFVHRPNGATLPGEATKPE